MSAWLALSLVLCTRGLETKLYSVDEADVRKREVLFIRNWYDLTRLAVVNFDSLDEFLFVPLYHGSEDLVQHRLDKVRTL